MNGDQDPIYYREEDPPTPPKPPKKEKVKQEKPKKAARPDKMVKDELQAAARDVKRQKSKKRGHFPMVPMILFICFVIIAMAGVQFYRNWTIPVDANDTTVVEIEIPEGATVSQMGEILEDEGIIRSSLSFKMFVKARGVEGDLQAGVHSVSPSMSLGQVVANLQEGAKEAGMIKVSVAEGLTLEEIADVVGQSTRYSAEEFMTLVQDDAFLQQLVSEYPLLSESYNAEGVRYVLEGYLFPATYDFNEDDGLESLVRQMVGKTFDVISAHQAEFDSSAYSVQDIMSLASLIEKEGGQGEDRRIISGVFYNRLEQNMPIQSDISVLYALGTHKEVVTFKDLEVDSPYNLYTNTGLPPGPMNSPSEDAIIAALEPQDNDYLYFYANIKTGEVFYTDDYNQHIAWQKEYEETGTIKK